MGGFKRDRVALGAPLIEAAAARRPLPELRPIIVPGLLGGLVGALLLIVLAPIAPPALAAAQTRFDLPLFVRVLYGGLTEEVLIRWGLMTLLAWLMARVLSSRFGAPSHVVMWTAVVVSALVFGAGHLPAAKLLSGPLTAPVVAYVLAGNSAFGIVAGWLYWRRGLESAMLAHAVAHTVAWAAAVVVG